LAKELLDKEVLHKSDVEELIGKRPFEEKKVLEIEPEESKEHFVSQDTATSISNPDTSTEPSTIG
jgi:AFG3 family protein